MINERPPFGPADRSLPAQLGRLGVGRLVVVLVFGTVLTLVAANLVLVQGVAEADLNQHRRGLQDHAEAIADAVDLEFERAATALGTLSESAALAAGDLDAFEGEMRRVAVRLGGVSIGLTGADGQVVMNTWLPQGERRRGPLSLPAVHAMASGTTQISDVFRSRITGRFITVLAVPVLDPASYPGAPQASRALAIALGPERYARLLAEHRLPETPGLELILTDRVGAVIARTRRTGGEPRADLTASLEPGGNPVAAGPGGSGGGNGGVTGTLETGDPGGAPLQAAALPATPPLINATEPDDRVAVQARAAGSGYQVRLSVPAAELRAPLVRARWRAFGLGAAVLGLGLGSALLLGRRLRLELRRLAAADADTVAPGSMRTGLREVDVLAAALARTRRERDRAMAELRALFAVSPIGMARADLGGRVQDANAAFLAMVGLGTSELAAGEVRWDELTPPELLPRDERAITEAVRTGHCTPYEKAFQRADGTHVPVLVSLALLDRATGECAVFAVDLSQLRRTEAALAESEARLARALAAAAMASWEWDMQDGRVVGSDGREALYGRPPGTMRDGAQMLAAVHPDDRAAMRMAMERALDPAGDGAYEHEFRTQWPDGTVRWLHSRGSATRRDHDGRVLHLSGVVRDVSALKDAQERRELLVREVDHRAKNVLAVVQAVLKLTRAEDPRQYARIVEGRIAALSKAHTLLSRQHWAGADLCALLTEELAPFGASVRGYCADDAASAPDTPVRLVGPAVFLSPWTVQPLSMTLHELATNAAKYGALATPTGRVEVSWRVDADGRLILQWTEHGAATPPVEPKRKGFGTRVIDGAIGDQLGGQVSRVWAAGGLACRILLPPDRVAGDAAPRPTEYHPALPATNAGAWSGRRVLVIEDDALIAHGLVDALSELGITVIGPASTLEQALGLAATAPSLDAAVLDINLGGRLSLPVADVLAGRGVPFVFASGYGSLPRESVPERHRATPLLMKPVRAEAIVATLTRHATAVLSLPAHPAVT